MRYITFTKMLSIVTRYIYKVHNNLRISYPGLCISNLIKEIMDDMTKTTAKGYSTVVSDILLLF